MNTPKSAPVARIHEVRGLSSSQRRFADSALGRLGEAAFSVLAHAIAQALLREG